MTRSLPARPLALLFSTALLVAACGATTTSQTPAPTVSTAPSGPSSPPATPSTAPSDPGTPQPSGEVAALYDAIEDQVVAIRGLDPVDVARQTIGGDALKEMNHTSFDEDNPADYVAGNDRLLKALGLIDEDQSLRELYLDLIDSQVAGFYRPDEKTLYVVSRSGAVGGADKITFAHEYDHALQDANFPGVFDAQKDLLDQTDQAMARAAVYEGDATMLMTQWAIPNMTPADLQDYLAVGIRSRGERGPRAHARRCWWTASSSRTRQGSTSSPRSSPPEAGPRSTTCTRTFHSRRSRSSIPRSTRPARSRWR